MVEFPYTEFPPELVQVLEHLVEVKKLPVDYFGTAMLTAAGAMIGNSFGADYYGQKEVPCLYSVLVGRSSIGKTAAMSPMTKRVEHYEAMARQEWAREMREWEESDVEKKKPVHKQLFIQDTTAEAAARVLMSSPRGTILIRPEIKGFLAGLGAYKMNGGAGKDADFYKEVWDNHPIIINRVNGEGSIYIPSPFINIIGGIPRQSLKSLESATRWSMGLSPVSCLLTRIDRKSIRNQNWIRIP